MYICIYIYTHMYKCTAYTFKCFHDYAAIRLWYTNDPSSTLKKHARSDVSNLC